MGSDASPRMIGRYLLCDPIAAGGMATVHLGRFVGGKGFSRTVAIKQLHGHYAHDDEFVAMLLDEARLLARIRHSNVISPLDVVTFDGALFIVMEYVHAEPLSRLLREAKGPVPIRIGSAIMSQALLGLHAAHRATGENGESLDIVHRDVSPQNILVAGDGATKVVDFGIAKAAWRARTTHDGQLKGKRSYMAPEQFRGERVDHRTDLFASGAVLWELLTGRQLFDDDAPLAIERAILSGDVTAPSSVEPDIPPELDALVLRALSQGPEERFDSAQDMAMALENAVSPASALEIGAWVDSLVGSSLRARAEKIAELESLSIDEMTLPMPRLYGGHAERGALRPRPESRSGGRRRRWWAAIGAGAVAGAITGLLSIDGHRQSRAASPEGALAPGAATVLAGSRAAALDPPRPATADEDDVGAGDEPTLEASSGDEAQLERDEGPARGTSRAVAPQKPPGSPRPGSPRTAKPSEPRPRIEAAPRRESPSKIADSGTSSRPSTPGAMAAPDCTPPYVIDDNGIKRFLLECVTVGENR